MEVQVQSGAAGRSSESLAVGRCRLPCPHTQVPCQHGVITRNKLPSCPQSKPSTCTPGWSGSRGPTCYYTMQHLILETKEGFARGLLTCVALK